MKKILCIVLLLMLWILTGCASKSVDQIDVKAYVYPNGDLYVEELHTYLFEGEHSEVERNLEEVRHYGIEFFEAYIPPEGKELGEFAYEDSTWLDVDDRDDESLYTTKITAKDEEKRVYYRYRINEIASRFSDTGELYWDIFAFLDDDLKNITIETVFPKSIEKSEVETYAFNRLGGGFTDITNQSVVYHTDELSKYDALTLHYLFPQQVLNEKVMEDSNTTRENRMVNMEAWYRYLEDQTNKLNFANSIIKAGNYLVLVIVILLLLPINTMFSSWRARYVQNSELEKMDPVLMMLLVRKGNLKVKDFLAGIFSLESTGLLDYKFVNAAPRFQKDPTAPNRSISFSFNSNINEFKRKTNNVKKSNVNILQWLFNTVDKTSGTRKFTLGSIAGPTLHERAQRTKRSKSQYRNKLRTFRRNFATWNSHVEEDYGVERLFNRNKMMKWISRSIVIIHFIIMVYLYFTYIGYWYSILWLFIILGIFGIIAFTKYQKKSWTVVFLIICLLFGFQFINQLVSEYYIFTLLLSFLLVAAVPRETLSLEASKNRAAIIRWRSTLKKGGYPIDGDPKRILYMLQRAVLLGVGKPFVTQFEKKYPNELPNDVPIFISQEAVEIIEYTRQTLQVDTNRNKNKRYS